MKFNAFFRYFAIACSFILLPATSLFAVDGIAVSIKGYGGSGNCIGSINRIDIQNSKVVKDTIIHSEANGQARMPCLSFDGTRVCFFRDGDKRVNSEIVAGTTDWVSVMNIDGSNLQNVVEFAGAMAQNHYDYTQGGPDRIIDWPAGDWIYYQKPTTVEIWRYNTSTSVNENVVSYPNGNGTSYINRWNLNADASHACQYSYYCEFPGKTNCAQGQGFGCNHTLSASGRFANGWQIWVGNDLWDASFRAVGQGGGPGPYDTPYQGRQLNPGGHCYFEYVDWDWTTGIRKSFGIYLNDCLHFRHISYLMGSAWLEETIGYAMVGAWSEYPRWATNSDKWIMHAPGKQQVLWNWVNREAILGGRNDAFGLFGNDAGDFWVKPPNDAYIGTHYEDCSGEWLPIGTQSTCPLPDYIRCPDCADPHECALKYGDIVIMPQSIYDSISKGQETTTQLDYGNLAYSWAVALPDFHTIVVQTNSSIELTVTNQYYDPIDPVFGIPAPTVSWSIIGQGASISPAQGLKSTLTTTSGFSSCSVEVSITVGGTTKTARKVVATEPVNIKSALSKPVAQSSGIRIISQKKSILVVSDFAGMQAVEIYNAGGTLIYKAAVESEPAAIPAGIISSGMYLVRVRRSNGSMEFLRWMAH